MKVYLLSLVLYLLVLCNSQSNNGQSGQSNNNNNNNSNNFQYTRLSANNTAILLVDHQSGLANGVLDINQVEFKNNLVALAKIAKLFNIPVVVTTSRQESPNGPYLSDVLNELPDNYAIIHRPGEINAWDNQEFQDAVNKTGATKFIVSGIVTEVCVAFVTLSLIEEGYDVYAAVDSSGTYSTLVADAARERMIQAGVVPITWFAIACELQEDWRNTETVEGFTNILREHLPFYSNLIESWTFTSQQQGNPSQGNPSQGNPSQGKPPQGNPSQGNPSQGNPSQGNPSQGNPSQGNPSQGNPSQGKPPQGNPSQGNPSQGNPSQGKPGTSPQPK